MPRAQSRRVDCSPACLTLKKVIDGFLRYAILFPWYAFTNLSSLLLHGSDKCPADKSTTLLTKKWQLELPIQTEKSCGSLAIIPPKGALDPWLCVPAFRQVCLERRIPGESKFAVRVRETERKNDFASGDAKEASSPCPKRAPLPDRIYSCIIVS